MFDLVADSFRKSIVQACSQGAFLANALSSRRIFCDHFSNAFAQVLASHPLLFQLVILICHMLPTDLGW
jgi:hypothetical protein